MNRRVSGDAVLSRELARRVVRGYGQEFRFTWIDSARRKRDERIAQAVDRPLILRASDAAGDYQCRTGPRRPTIHADKLK